MTTLGETREFLLRHRQELDKAWSQDPQEYRALLSYIEKVSNQGASIARIRERSAESTLFVLGGRMPEDGIQELTQTFISERKIASCLVAESPQSCVLNAVQEDAFEIAERLRSSGWSGSVFFDNLAQNTGDQAVALISLLQTIPMPQTLVVCASIDHVGRMAATFMDALEAHGLISDDLCIIPLAFGDWTSMYAHGFTYEELAFGYEPAQEGEGESLGDQERLFHRLSGQYTFRWQRSLRAKEKGEWIGRTIVKPSEALRIIS